MHDFLNLKRVCPVSGLGVMARAVIVIFASLIWLVAQPGNAQSGASREASIETRLSPPNGISLQSISADRAALEAEIQLTDELKKTALAFYDAAEVALTTAQDNQSEIKQLKTLSENAPSRLETLNAQIKTLQDTAPMEMSGDEDMNAQTLADLQQSLIAKEIEQRTLRTRLEDLTIELESLQNQREEAPAAQTQAQSQINTITETLDGLPSQDLSPVEAAQSVSLRARRYRLRTTIALTQQRMLSFSDRQNLLTLRRDLTQLELSRLDADVAMLQRLTGQQKVLDAQAVISETVAQREATEALHPMVKAYADGNVARARELGALAKAAGELPRKTAQTRSRVDIINGDLRTATLLIELGNLSRQSAQTLRKLRNDTPSALSVQGTIKSINAQIARATQARLLAQDQLRDLLPGELDIRVYQDNYGQLNPDSPPLTEADKTALEDLHARRRALYTAISREASDYYDSLTTLKTVTDTLLSRTEALNAQLDQNLLWLPSTEAVGLSWPGEIITGLSKTFNAGTVTKSLAALQTGAARNPFLALIFIVLIIASYAMRKSLWVDILRRAKMVGRVQLDNHRHTPAVLFACMIIALPLALIFFLLGMFLNLAETSDPFVEALSRSFTYLASFTLFFLTWRAWDRDGSLFDAHFHVPKALRHAINKNLVWFIPLAGAVSTVFVLTHESADRSVYEGLSLATFIALCLSLSAFSYLILWPNRKERDMGLSEDNIIRRYRLASVLISAGVPLLCAGAAMLGYFDTAVEIMDRFFTSSLLVITTYVAYGVIRRFIVVGKRRLALREAIARRDKAVKQRQEKAAAEERGDMVMPPPLDYKTIDVETLSRQTAQLIYGLIILAFAGLAYMIWADLLPALSFFNGVELSSYMVDEIDPDTGQEISVTRTITLWNVMQAIVIAGAAVLAARNLPSFLEIFVLNRVGIDAGTRYAIVTILGYIIIALGIFFTFDRLGLQWSELKFVVAGLSVGIGLGLQKIIANFVSGLIILFERPIRVNDYVTIGDQSGTVSRIKIRATTLVDLDNKEILIPNEELISQRVTNWTLSSSVTRLIVRVGIAYGSDTELAQTVMLGALKANKLILDTPAPQVLFMGFGDSSLDFELRAFLNNFEDRVPTTHNIHNDVNKALSEANISIPFPQRDLHIITPAPEPTKPKPKAKRKPNAKPA